MQIAIPAFDAVNGLDSLVAPAILNRMNVQVWSCSRVGVIFGLESGLRV